MAEKRITKFDNIDSKAFQVRYCESPVGSGIYIPEVCLAAGGGSITITNPLPTDEQLTQDWINDSGSANVMGDNEIIPAPYADIQIVVCQLWVQGYNFGVPITVSLRSAATDNAWRGAFLNSGSILERTFPKPDYWALNPGEPLNLWLSAGQPVVWSVQYRLQAAP